MDQDAASYMEVGVGPGDIVLDGDPAPLFCMEVGLRPCRIVLDGDPAPLAKKLGRYPQFSAHFIVAKRLNASRCHSAWS